MDCFAALAMTERQWICFAALAMTGRALLRHCEERSDEAIHSFLRHGLLRCARNDGEAMDLLRCARNDGTRAPPSLRGAQRRSNPFFLEAWIASLRSQWGEAMDLLRCARNDGE